MAYKCGGLTVTGWSLKKSRSNLDSRLESRSRSLDLDLALNLDRLYRSI